MSDDLSNWNQTDFDKYIKMSDDLLTENQRRIRDEMTHYAYLKESENDTFREYVLITLGGHGNVRIISKSFSGALLTALNIILPFIYVMRYKSIWEFVEKYVIIYSNDLRGEPSETLKEDSIEDILECVEIYFENNDMFKLVDLTDLEVMSPFPKIIKAVPNR
jgi:hypothetical protein